MRKGNEVALSAAIGIQVIWVHAEDYTIVGNCVSPKNNICEWCKGKVWGKKIQRFEKRWPMCLYGDFYWFFVLNEQVKV